MPFYAVAKGRQIGIFTNWDDCKAQTDGFPRPIYRKFATKDEAQSFIDQNSSHAAAGLSNKATLSSIKGDLLAMKARLQEMNREQENLIDGTLAKVKTALAATTDNDDGLEISSSLAGNPPN